MKNQLILHIPHSSVIIPCNNSYSCSQLELEAVILKLTDWYTYELFHSFDNEMIASTRPAKPPRFSSITVLIISSLLLK